MCEAGWHAIVGGDQVIRGIFAVSAGLPLGICGIIFPVLRKHIPDEFRQKVQSQAVRWTPFAFLAAFIYTVCPYIYNVPYHTSTSTVGHYISTGQSEDTFFDGRPLGFWWGASYLDIRPLPGTTTSLTISTFNVRGKNLGVEEVQIADAYIISGVDSTKLPMLIAATPSGWTDVKDILPVPPNAEFFLQADFSSDHKDMPEAEFMKRWSHFRVVIQSNNGTVRHDITENEIRSWLYINHPELAPHVTRRPP